MLEASWDFSAELQTVREARRFLLRTLASWDSDSYDFAGPVVLSELATNATLHAKTPYTVELRLLTRHLLVSVADANPQLPQSKHYGSEATTGRGMNLVASLSSRWGAAPTASGKTVWAYVLPDHSAMFDLRLGDDENLGEQAPSSAVPRDSRTRPDTTGQAVAA
jgi:anti-sigma regulatory factor (Ser/Thr protein kinase)